MNDEPATRDSWKIQPMPAAKIRLHVDRMFTEEEYHCLQKGFLPEEMEDKWFAYFENEWLFIHRSWTGFCIYQVHLVPSGSEYSMDEIWVNGDTDQFTPRTSWDLENPLSVVIDMILSGE
jgi:hypothetical protein